MRSRFACRSPTLSVSGPATTTAASVSLRSSAATCSVNAALPLGGSCAPAEAQANAERARTSPQSRMNMPSSRDRVAWEFPLSTVTAGPLTRDSGHVAHLRCRRGTRDRSSRSGQRMLQIADQVVGAFQADGEAQQVRRAGRARTFDAGAMLQQAL